MSYRRTWSKTFSSDEFKDPDYPIGTCPPVRCPDHKFPDGRSKGFRAIAVTPTCFKTIGSFRLRSPIRVQEVMPGEKQKVLTVNILGMHKIGWGTIIDAQGGSIEIIGDDVELWKSPDISSEEDRWATNPFSPNLKIESITNMDLKVDIFSIIAIGYLERHQAELRVDCEYYSYEPPETADVDVNVVNKQTGRAVWRALVEILSGAVVVASGLTDFNGNISFANIEEGSYTLRVTASGYYEFSQSIEVIPPKVSYRVKLAPVPSILPWWVLPLGVIAVVGGGAYYLTRPKKPGVVVVK